MLQGNASRKGPGQGSEYLSSEAVHALLEVSIHPDLAINQEELEIHGIKALICRYAGFAAGLNKGLLGRTCVAEAAYTPGLVVSTGARGVGDHKSSHRIAVRTARHVVCP